MIRPARPEDMPACAELESLRPTSAGWRESQFRAELGRGDRVFLVAEEGGRVLGHALAWVVGEESQLLTIAVRPEAARKGLGAALLDGLRARAKALLCRRLTLEVSERNAPALALYARAGGRVVGRRPKFYNDGSDALLMDIPL